MEQPLQAPNWSETNAFRAAMDAEPWAAATPEVMLGLGWLEDFEAVDDILDIEAQQSDASWLRSHGWAS